MSGICGSVDELARGDAAEQLDIVVATLNEICRTATLNVAFRVGEYVIKSLFSGDSALWKNDRARCPTYRALAARGDLCLSASALCRAVGVYVLVEQLGGCERFRYLTASHFQEVLALDELAQLALLTEAERGRWSVARMRLEAANYKGSPSAAPQLGVLRNLKRVEVSLGKQRAALVHGGVCPSGIAGDALREKIGAIRRELDELEAWFEEEPAPRNAPLKSDVMELLGNSKSFVK